MEFPELTECAFNIVSESGKVCSSGEGIALMKKLITGVSDENTMEDIKAEEIVQAAKEKTNCDSESCVVASKEFEKIAGPTVAKTILKTRFKPDGPWDNDEWLSNSNIDEVLDQWADIYPGFHNFHFR